MRGQPRSASRPPSVEAVCRWSGLRSHNPVDAFPAAPHTCVQQAGRRTPTPDGSATDQREAGTRNVQVADVGGRGVQRRWLASHAQAMKAQFAAPLK
jgi:hypothetical protein